MIDKILGSNVRSDFRRILKILQIQSKLDSFAQPRVGFHTSDNPSLGGESVLVNGAVFKTVSETVRAGSGRFDSYTPPPGSER